MRGAAAARDTSSVIVDTRFTSLCADGDLLIDLRPLIDARLRFEHWNAGLRLYRWCEGQWLRELDDMGIALLSPANDRDPDLPVNRFAADIPIELRARAATFQYLQTILLQWCARQRAAADLLVRSPNLLWLLLGVARDEGWSRAEIIRALRLRRRDILGLLTGCSREGAVRVLDRLVVPQGNLVEYKTVKGFMQDRNGTLWQELQQAPKVTVALMALVRDCPHLRGSCLFRTFIAKGPGDLATALSLVRWTDHLWGDALRIAGQCGILDAAKALSRCTTPTGVQRLHHRWARQRTARLNTHQGRQALRAARVACKGKPPFWPAPPIPGNGDIEPILSWEDLIEEGHIMEHCVAQYSAAVRSGKSFIYRVFRPERATIEIKRGDDELHIAQVWLFRNRSPAPETLQAIDAWFSASRCPGTAAQPQSPNNCQTGGDSGP